MLFAASFAQKIISNVWAPFRIPLPEKGYGADGGGARGKQAAWMQRMKEQRKGTKVEENGIENGLSFWEVFVKVFVVTVLMDVLTQCSLRTPHCHSTALELAA